MKSVTLLASFAALSTAAPLDLLTDLVRRAKTPHAFHYFPSYQAPAQTSTAASSAAVPVRIQDVSSAAVTPSVKSAQVLGLVADPALSRDSCGSCVFGNRTLWTCRDTQYYNSDGTIDQNILLSSSASWSDMTSSGPALQPVTSTSQIVLKEYGNNGQSQAFYPWNPSQFCQQPNGGCSDGSRWALWPDSRPMKVSTTVAYTWILDVHFSNTGAVEVANPPTTLYKITYDPTTSSSSPSTLPQASPVNSAFWGQNEIPYGVYGNVVRNGVTYLYGLANGTVALAKVPSNQVETKSAYQYWVNGAWVSTPPAIGASGINVANSNAGGQGTYYFSSHWNSYVWIGGGQYPGSYMYITTAPDPTGPWIKPFIFYTAPNGNYSYGAYTIQANPALTVNTPDANEIYTSYTKLDKDPNGVVTVTTPLVRVQWN